MWWSGACRIVSPFLLASVAGAAFSDNVLCPACALQLALAGLKEKKRLNFASYMAGTVPADD